MNVVTFNYTFAANNIYILAVPYNLAGPDLIDSEDYSAIRFMSEIPSRQRVSSFVMAGQPATTFRPDHSPKCS
ncbi:hypothetical protein JCM2811A_19830 [Methylorubrum rhodinum]